MLLLLSVLCYVLIPISNSLTTNEYAFNQVFENKLIQPGDLKYTDDKYIHIGMILANVSLAEKTFETSKLGAKLKKLTRSMFFTSRGSRLHLVFLTDTKAKEHIKRTLVHEMGRILSKKVIGPGVENLWSMYWKFPRSIKVEFVDIGHFSKNYRNEIDVILKYYGKAEDPIKKIGLDGREYTIYFDKYQQDLFYIGPLYDKAFPAELNYIIMLDVDLEFKSDVAQLEQQRKLMSPSHVMGVGVELDPHYFTMLINHRLKFPNSTAGMLGRNQGLNTGVVIYELDKMRKSQLYQDSLTLEKYKHMTEELYLYNGGLGDQDLYTQLGWHQPELFYVLPCQFNVQIHKKVFSKIDEQLKEYYLCSSPNPVIIHDNTIEISEETNCMNMRLKSIHMVEMFKMEARNVAFQKNSCPA